MNTNWKLEGPKGTIEYVGNETCQVTYKEDNGSTILVTFLLSGLPEWINRIGVTQSEYGHVRYGQWKAEE